MSVVQKPLFEFGEQIVYAEPSWYQCFESPYYTQGHREWRARMRAFVDKEIAPFVDDWEEANVQEGKEMPARELIRKAYEAGLYSPMWPKELGGTPPADGFDVFHDLIGSDEICRVNSTGVTAIFGITTMALPPILDHGSKEMIETVGRDIICGRKYAALAISEPYAGSDVANIRTTAKREGDFYILNGEKKWITMGVFADYFTVACRTGGKGHKGLSLLLVDRHAPGVTVKRMKLQGYWLGGTAFITFDDVKVPVKNLIGTENHGFRYIMHNFNHERFVVAIQANRASRTMLSESMKYAAKRKTFGKTLIEHQVIRQKLADMAMRVEAVHALIESVAFQMKQGMSNERLGGVMALLKVMATRTTELCTREASQIFGGASYVRGGVGAKVERGAREVRAVTVPGGSDEILADLAVRQAMLLTARFRMEQALSAEGKTEKSKL